ncbi:MAG: leucine-rich repeat domain-containing protein [Clostridia bacterium]|nr:leucine-rich repeat domain-containing protein [Clostridia bacterium]
MEEMSIWEHPVVMADEEPPVIIRRGVYMYQRTKKGCELLRCDRTESVIDLPDELDGRPLTVIGAGAMRHMDRLEEVFLPEGLRRIGDYAFYEDENLRVVSIPHGTRRIGMHAFDGCTQLRHVFVPPTVVEIGENAFPDQEGLTLRGEMNSAVHRYAEENGLFFIAASEPAA